MYVSFPELHVLGHKAGPQVSLKIWRGGSSDQRPFEGAGFVSIPTKIVRGTWGLAPLPPSSDSDVPIKGRNSLTTTYILREGFFYLIRKRHARSRKAQSKSLYISRALSYFYETKFETCAGFGPAWQFKFHEFLVFLSKQNLFHSSKTGINYVFYIFFL